MSLHRYQTQGAQQSQAVRSQVQEHLLQKILWLARNGALVQHDALKGECSGYYHWRLSDYRIIYGLEESERLLTMKNRAST
jgi:hypothetical protein